MMTRHPSIHVSRRTFAIWCALLGGPLAARLAAEELSTVVGGSAIKPHINVPNFVHWSIEEDEHWQWFRKESIINGIWRNDGTTAAVHKETMQERDDSDSKLSRRRVPSYVRQQQIPRLSTREPAQFDPSGPIRMPSPYLRSLDGKPPSNWLLDLYANELQAWLRTLKDVPEATVSGMTIWLHLTRDHGFDPRRIEGLTNPELGQLHSATHYGF